ncbi:hypothetical protein VM636_24805 [Streptomyces sp. SCSIO 75703]|uniref:hypothetical protein n=1 Tax=unclassified Streptomyces TaxID=2593676 RepID=UPI0004C1CC29|nr:MULTISPECIES: hypothetical protein [unclassified Streptomyces]
MTRVQLTDGEWEFIDDAVRGGRISGIERVKDGKTEPDAEDGHPRFDLPLGVGCHQVRQMAVHA